MKTHNNYYLHGSGVREPNTSELNCEFCVYMYYVVPHVNNLVTFTMYTYLYCMPRVRTSISFEPTMHITVSVAHAFGTIGHVQQSVRTGKCTLKEFEEVSKVSNTTEAKIWSFLKTAMCFFASLATAPLSY